MPPACSVHSYCTCWTVYLSSSGLWIPSICTLGLYTTVTHKFLTWWDCVSLHSSFHTCMAVVKFSIHLHISMHLIFLEELLVKPQMLLTLGLHNVQYIIIILIRKSGDISVQWDNCMLMIFGPSGGTALKEEMILSWESLLGLKNTSRNHGLWT